MNRFKFIEDHHRAWGVKRLCHVLEVARSSFYKWRAGRQARAARERADAALAERIRAVHAEWDGTYGRPRITAELCGQGEHVNHKHVGRVMRKFGIAGLRLRKRQVTTVPEPSATPVPDLFQRDFTASAPNTKYVGSMKQHHDVEVRRRCATACHDAASQERGSRVVVMLIYDGACCLDRIHTGTIGTNPPRAHTISRNTDLSQARLTLEALKVSELTAVDAVGARIDLEVPKVTLMMEVPEWERLAWTLHGMPCNPRSQGRSGHFPRD